MQVPAPPRQPLRRQEEVHKVLLRKVGPTLKPNNEWVYLQLSDRRKIDGYEKAQKVTLQRYFDTQYWYISF